MLRNFKVCIELKKIFLHKLFPFSSDPYYQKNKAQNMMVKKT